LLKIKTPKRLRDPPEVGGAAYSGRRIRYIPDSAA